MGGLLDVPVQSKGDIVTRGHALAAHRVRGVPGAGAGDGVVGAWKAGWVPMAGSKLLTVRRSDWLAMVWDHAASRAVACCSPARITDCP